MRGLRDNSIAMLKRPALIVMPTTATVDGEQSLLLRVVGHLPAPAMGSQHEPVQGQVSDKPQGRKPRGMPRWRSIARSMAIDRVASIQVACPSLMRQSHKCHLPHLALKVMICRGIDHSLVRSSF